MYRFLGLVLLPTLVICACSSGGKCPSGSECSLVDCSCTDVKCDLYTNSSGVYTSVKVYYMNNNQGTKYTAVVTIDISKITEIAGHEFTGSEMQSDVTLYNPDNNWKAFTTDSHCKIDSFGGPNGKFEGNCVFIFDNTTRIDNAFMPFDCTLTAVSL